MTDLRALFSSNDPVDSSEAFTNRQGQWELVATALAEHLRHVTAPGFDPADLEAPRTHLIVFHGVGGVGKSTLLRKLEAALGGSRPAQWGEPVWSGRRILPVRIDLARSAGTTFEDVVLTIRAALAAAVARPLPAFDIALRRYWEAQHPAEPLGAYLERGGLAARFGKALPQQTQAVLSDIAQALLLPGTVGSVAGEVVTTLIGALRERRQTVRALAACTRLAPLLESEPSLEALSFYPHLLAWELHELPDDKKTVPVILLDTFEDTADRHRDLERLLQRLVWLLPNCFFVISGRNRLQWADPALHGELDYTGPTAWPRLATAPGPLPLPRHSTPAGRQHLIGDLSPEDCDDHLARRLTQDGRPLITPEIRAVITARSHGLPLHLDLAVARFLDIRRTREPQPADFDHTFPALLARALSDLTPDERHVLRSVSLLDAFDLDLATRAAGLTHQAPARRLTERPIVQANPYALWPYHLHGAIRSALTEADDHTDDRWTPADWHQAATRALAALGDQWATNTALTPSRLLLVACLRQGLRLARDHRLSDLGWLTDAAHAYTDDSVWEPLTPPTTPASAGGPHLPLDTPADALAELLTAIARRQHEHRRRTADRLTAILDTGLLPPELTAMALYYRAKAYKDLGHNGASRAGMQAVADAGGRLAPKARRGLANLARISGDFPAALAAVPTLGWKGRHHRVEGDIHWPHGDITRAVTAFTAARAEAEQHNAAGERAIAQVRLALAVSFTDPARAADELTLADQLLDGLDQRATTLLARTAALIADAGTGDVTDRAHHLHTDIDNAGLPFLTRFAELALAFHHAVRGDHHNLTASLGRLNELTATGDFAYFTDIAHFMARRLLLQPSTTRWLEPEETVRRRWETLVAERRHHLGIRLP
ncbi:ATP/GTP-binding protein [Streptomyces lavenduligriseus]|uniref:ATP/GTP-binding protein n=2 Tax=Actinomycetes TaxID=1760 RepID=A0ABT0P5I9_9ACTN|nr:ATP/GTP-binding protein [Streptomyces lavenduligriseus]MCL3998203.1 ATP/GTP-binding protein [Streptomyces lavenduligriseus]